MKKITLLPEAEQDALRSLKEYYQSEREEELSDFQARGILEFFLSDLGCYVYNQALADAHALMADRIEDLYGLTKYPERQK